MSNENPILDYAGAKTARRKAFRKKPKPEWSQEKLLLVVLGTVLGAAVAYILIACLLAQLGLVDLAG